MTRPDDTRHAAVRRVRAVLVGLLLTGAVTVRPAAAAAAAADDGQPLDLAGDRARPPSRDRHVDYRLDLAGQRAVLRQPAGVAADERVGLVVYVPPDDGLPGVPDGWAAVLDAHRLAFAGVGGAGNGRPVSRRCGLAVAAAGRVMATCRVDPARVYAAGFSGGARVAGLLGFYQPDVFRGTVQCCGADYYRRVPHADPAVAAQAAGPLLADAAEAARAKPRVRFALVTGDGDPNHGLMADVFHGGYEPDHFRATLIDTPGTGHRPAAAAAFAAAIEFIERSPTTRP